MVRKRALELSVGFPPVADARARVLVLGSLPGQRSLALREYYAQPHNAFWKIMGRLVGAEPALPYAARLAALRAHGIALWDVLAAGERAGSLDSAIVPASIVLNDFAGFLARHRRIRAILFNGNKAAELYRRHVEPGLPARFAVLPKQVLPSTSPAYAALSFERKLARWTTALTPATAPRARGPDTR